MRTSAKSAPNADSMRVRALLSSGAPRPSDAETPCGDAAARGAPPGPSLNSMPAALDARSPMALTAEDAMLAGDMALRRARISLRVRSQSGGIRSEAVVAPPAPGALLRTDCS